jgi:hypothetical protein
MALLTRKEFAELCKDRQDAIVTYIRRGKIVIVPGGELACIDPENPENKAFLEKRLQYLASKNAPKEKIQAKNEPIEPKRPQGRPRKGEEKPKATPAEIKQKERIIAEQAVMSRHRMDQEMQKKALEIENLELSKQQKLLLLNKSAGKLMPVDLVRGVIKRHADTINKNFENGIETLITLMVNVTAGGDQVLIARFTGEAKEILSKNIVTAGAQAEEEIIILVDEFSQQLLRGQKKV